MLKKFRSNLAFNIIGALVLLMLVFSWVVSIIGYVSFTNSFKREYSTSTFHMAQTAATLVNGDSIDRYLENGIDDEYKQTKRYLDTYCKKMNVSIIYVIKPDKKDYGSFVSVFNCVNNSVDNTEYTEWELGFERETTNEEYREKYIELYSQKKDFETVYRTTKLNGLHAHITTLVPIKNSSGEVVSLLCIQRPMRELHDGTLPYLLNVAISTIFFSVVAAIIAANFIKWSFIKPIRRVISEAHRFAEENTQGEKLGDGISTLEEITTLAKSIDTMEEKMMDYVENLKTATAERERIGAELNIASIIQENSLPNTFPAFPDRTDFDIFASMTPAKEVGGDYYNFFLIDETHLAVVIADVSGKGVPAALFMMVSNILISEATRITGNPAEVLTKVNDRICDHNKADMFVTVWLGIIDTETGIITAANAGHDDPAIYRRDGSFEIVKNKHGLVLGAMKGLVYKEFEIQLNEGDKLFIYTDGIPEATDANEKMFTIDGMIDALNEYKDASPQEIINGVKKSVDNFVGSAPQFDDMTMLCVELKENDNNSLTVDATNENLHTVTEFVDAFLEENGCSMKTQMSIDLSLEEAFVNVANYAYGDETGKATIELTIDGREVSITLTDSGTPYNPLEKADPDTSLSADEREIGGLGIFLVKKNMDSVSYVYENDKNILTMKKTI
ncbi:MAG: SpoIIE family protein phosphatase [Eubacterium sp.]|nr:SpoIIE family protein phosphatase [Eubacterium sp.]